MVRRPWEDFSVAVIVPLSSPISESRMRDPIQSILDAFRRELAAASTAADLEPIRIKYLARKGQIAALYDGLRDVPATEKPAVGKEINELRDILQRELDAKREGIESSRVQSMSNLDLSLPGRPRPIGTKHPITQTIDEIKTIFARMGFTVADGPEIETDYYNFEALNFPPEHPARDMQDTFFVANKVVLRTHTSPVQIRVMESQPPPVRVIIPGRVYRNEAVSTRSHVLFHQIEGLYVDRGVTFSELKGTLVSFVRQFYGSDVKYKFRPTFFPFTEPSADMYISCFICSGKGCRVCKFGGWLEILGSGMVHPNLYKYVGYDPEAVSGYAFGMGIERIAMLRYGIDDIRLFFENDIRFLKMF